MPHSDERRGGVSPLFYVGLLLWALLFAGLYFLKFRTAEPEPTREEIAARKGVVDLDEPEPDSEDDGTGDGKTTKTVQITGDGFRVLKPGEKPKLTWDPNGIEDFELTERSGKTVTRKEILGRPTVFGFVFTRCAGPCPKVTKAMYDLEEATREFDVRFVTVTVDPEFDTAERLANYADIFSADADRWWFLTGDRDAIYEMINRSFKMPVQKVASPDGEMEYDVIHTSNLMLVDVDGVVREKFNAITSADVRQLQKRLREMAQENETTPADAVRGDPPGGAGGLGGREESAE